MKTLKYGLSGLVMAALTLLFLCIPTLYYRLTDRENANVSTREIYLEQTADPLTPSQTIRLLHDNASTGLFSRVQNNRSTDEYLAKAPTLIQAVCGPASYLTKLLIGRLPGPAAVTVETYRFLTMSGYDVLTRTVVMAYFGDLYICYNHDTAVMQLQNTPSVVCRKYTAEGVFYVKKECGKEKKNARPVDGAVSTGRVRGFRCLVRPVGAGPVPAARPGAVVLSPRRFASERRTV